MTVSFAGQFVIRRGRASVAEREVLISNAALRVSLELPSGLLTVRDRRAGIEWKQFAPFQSARGRKWGDVVTARIGTDSLIRLKNATVAGRTVMATAVWRDYPFTVLFQLAPKTPY